MENLYTPDCIRTVSGKYVNVFNPKPEMFCIEDIAHALSMQPRFGGHLPVFYSVAQHSILVSISCPKDDQLSGLMHDASEAYLMDIPRPIKGRLSNYKEIEHGLMVMLSDIFKFEYPLPESVKRADELMLNREWHEIMLEDAYCEPMGHRTAKERFLETYNRLTMP